MHRDRAAATNQAKLDIIRLKIAENYSNAIWRKQSRRGSWMSWTAVAACCCTCFASCLYQKMFYTFINWKCVTKINSI